MMFGSLLYSQYKEQTLCYQFSRCTSQFHKLTHWATMQNLTLVDDIFLFSSRDRNGDHLQYFLQVLS